MEKIIAAKKAYIAELEAKNCGHRVFIHDNEETIQMLKLEVEKIESNKWLQAFTLLLNSSPCSGFSCGRCKYHGDCNFTPMLNEVRRIKKEFEAFGFDLRK
jgi:hypothetical protein